MKKQIEAQGINYEIEVTLNTLVEKRFGGKRFHTATVKNLQTNHEDTYQITDLKQLSDIEESLRKQEKSPFEWLTEELKELGYK